MTRRKKARKCRWGKLKRPVGRRVCKTAPKKAASKKRPAKRRRTTSKRSTAAERRARFVSDPEYQRVYKQVMDAQERGGFPSEFRQRRDGSLVIEFDESSAKLARRR